MTKMATMPIYGKNLKKNLWNQEADDLACWYVASGARVLPSFFKWWPWVDIDLFYGKVKFGPLCFSSLSAIVFYVHLWQKWVLYTVGIRIKCSISTPAYVAYHISMDIYKLFDLASLPKNDFMLVLYCFMSILDQWNGSIKTGLVMWLLRSRANPFMPLVQYNNTRGPVVL